MGTRTFSSEITQRICVELICNHRPVLLSPLPEKVLSVLKATYDTTGEIIQ